MFRIRESCDSSSRARWKSLDWPSLFRDLPNLRAIDLDIGDTIPLPKNIPSSVPSVRYRTRRYYSYWKFLDDHWPCDLPPSVTHLTAEYGAWPPCFRLWTERLAGRDLTIRAPLCVNRDHPKLPSDEAAILSSLQEELNRYSGGRTITLSICDGQEKRTTLYQEMKKCLLGRGRFDQVRVLVQNRPAEEWEDIRWTLMSNACYSGRWLCEMTPSSDGKLGPMISRFRL